MAITTSPGFAELIQLAVGPVFLLAGIGAMLNAMTGRLGRVVDRARQLEASLPAMEVDADRLARQELASLDRRMMYANRAIGLCVSSAICVCLLVALMFLSIAMDIPIGLIVAGLFVIAMALLTLGLISFWLEVQRAAQMLRVRTELCREPG